MGIPRPERGPRSTEQVKVLNQLFTGGSVSYDGWFHSFEDVRIDPVVNEPPRIAVGGGWLQEREGEPHIPEPVLDRILLADGWIGANTLPDEAAVTWDVISEHARDRGVDPESIDRLMILYTHLVDSSDPEYVREEQRAAFGELWPPSVRSFEEYVTESAAVGTLDAIEATLHEYRKLGFDQVILAPADHDPESLQQQMSLLTDRLLPSFS